MDMDMGIYIYNATLIKPRIELSCTTVANNFRPRILNMSPTHRHEDHSPAHQVLLFIVLLLGLFNTYVGD